MLGLGVSESAVDRIQAAIDHLEGEAFGAALHHHIDALIGQAPVMVIALERNAHAPSHLRPCEADHGKGVVIAEAAMLRVVCPQRMDCDAKVAGGVVQAVEARLAAVDARESVDIIPLVGISEGCEIRKATLGEEATGGGLPHVGDGSGSGFGTRGTRGGLGTRGVRGTLGRISLVFR